MKSQENTKQKSVSFDNLKKLNAIWGGNELNSIVARISKSRTALETFCKNLKNKEVELKKQASKQVVEEKVVQSKPVVQSVETTVKTSDSNVSKVAKAESSTQSFDRPQKKNFDQKPNKDGLVFNKVQSKDRFNKTDNRQKPQDGKPQFEKKAFVPRDNNGFKPKNNSKPEIAETIITKPERNFGNKNKTKTYDTDKKELSKKTKMKMGYIDIDDNYMDDGEERMGRVRTKAKKQKVQVVPEKIVIEKAVIDTENLTVKILSEKIGKPAVDIIKKFMMLGMMPNINSVIDFATAELVAQEFGVTLEQKISKNYEETLLEMFEKQSNSTEVRPPVVTVMGHVDHGKTSLLDAIRNTNVIEGEAGGITQHIGAYTVDCNGQSITFIDTPGHAAFTAIRARGAKLTDVAVLVVAADDGIMPQTVEAINHIKSANCPMIVAINKIDKPEANIDRVKQQLTEYDVLPEEWGGDVICVPISAKQNQNIDKLLESILLVSEMLELKADSTQDASGTIIESKVDKGRGIMATVLIKNGTLKVGDFIVSGIASGRIRAMIDYKGNSVKVAPPSMPVSILGFNAVPEAGDMAYVVDEKMARNIVEERTSRLQMEKIEQNNGITLEDFLQQSADSEVKVLKLIIKADVKGSCEALKMTLEKIHNDEAKVQVIHSGVGGINESDVILANASKAILIGFNVKPEAKAKQIAEREKIEIGLYKVIYDAVDDITNKINGMQAPKFEEVIVGHAEVRQIFKISSIGHIAGSYVLDGVINRDSKVRLLRNGNVIIDTPIDTLQHQKDQVKTVKMGYECGIKLKGFNDIEVGDIIEAYEMKQI
ncbi:MAG: translation initiation factor IF-2 [Clostridia bacterium]|nr:translation initiation factor IF-2 [Clostridia bacterium]